MYRTLFLLQLLVVAVAIQLQVDAMTMKHIFVTGASSGIGLALCKRLAVEHGCHVYLGSRNVGKGKAALKGITDKFPETQDLIEVVEIDVGNDESVKQAAKTIESKGVSLYALVNNAGILDQSIERCLNTNYYGPKRVTAAFLHLIDPKEGRIVNTSSGGASGFLSRQDEATKLLYSEPSSLEALEKSIESFAKTADYAYGFSKAALTAWTVLCAKENPNLQVVSLSPGWVKTPMTEGQGARLTPEQGCKALLRCLFEPVTSGWYYGSDGLRSPMTCPRDPGSPEYSGEPNPDRAKYSN